MEPSGKDLDVEEREMHTWGNGMTRRGDTGVHIWLRVLPQAATIRVHYTLCVAILYQKPFKPSGSGSATALRHFWTTAILFLSILSSGAPGSE